MRKNSNNTSPISKEAVAILKVARQLLGQGRLVYFTVEANGIRVAGKILVRVSAGRIESCFQQVVKGFKVAKRQVRAVKFYFARVGEKARPSDRKDLATTQVIQGDTLVLWPSMA